MKFVQNLKYLLKKHNVDVQTLSEKTGVSTAIIYKMAANKVARPSVYNILAIAAFFGLSAEELVSYDLVNDVWDRSYISSFPQVPLIRWEDAPRWGDDDTVAILGKVPTYSDSPIGKRAFALVIDTGIYAPKFPENTLFVVDPDAPLKHKHYVIVASKTTKKVALKQLFMADDASYLKSITFDISPDTPPVKKTDDDIIVGKVMFAKINL